VSGGAPKGGAAAKTMPRPPRKPAKILAAGTAHKPPNNLAAKSASNPASNTVGNSAVTKAGLHPRNRHRTRYDFARLVAGSSELARFVAPNAYGDATIDFADPRAVKALNRAILLCDYGVAGWDIPSGYLCPPIPGRADYLHYLADLLAEAGGGVLPPGEAVRVLDVGTGANCIYPLLGRREYGWTFVGSDIDARALASAQRILDANPALGAGIELRRQSDPEALFGGVLRAGEYFDLTMCNPPFHASLAEAQAGSRRKWRNLGKAAGNERGGAAARLNFGGQGAELCCPGGEAAFVQRMIEESRRYADRCLWFTTLLSKAASLPQVRAALGRSSVQASRTIAMAQGQKQSRIVAWTFLDPAARAAWRARRTAAA